jgi:hypothetical protein
VVFYFHGSKATNQADFYSALPLKNNKDYRKNILPSFNLLL